MKIQTDHGKSVHPGIVMRKRPSHAGSYSMGKNPDNPGEVLLYILSHFQ